MKGCYRHPRPAVTVDTVLLTRAPTPRLLLIRRGNPPFANHWALPGGFLDVGEDPSRAAARELAEETGLRHIPLSQVGTFGQPDRDPREQVVTIAYRGTLAEPAPQPRAADDAREARWFPLDQLPPLAFDHGHILARALARR